MDIKNINLVSNQVSEIILSYQPEIKLSDLPKITSSKEAYELLIGNWDQSKLRFIEQFKVMLLNRANKVLGIVNISTGGISGTVADPKLIFASALKTNSSAIILSHNHPSGNRMPSRTDRILTKKIVELGVLMELPVIDHIIVTSESYYSFSDEGGL
ncbi:JAB domain-containing protein [Echinicola vietnamensis]|uniref:DNA repair protein n=1 Tax=Echinicola vietnamensis (strain DSM 17526 / LMG 23754 / KMM 6221) TaxID=926556 RepID=L0G6Z3_ECHVK|nr:JAB domain-containing protein [Echinicola vietnamensis]AGA80615.1 DNA repair protein [Echinicola vietnamensis DSM 17526]